ncbi:MAG: hypothetical protein LBG06_12730 [Deltaproteobacteria bacterium]|nr:hypothetical protein [Deltaproteobacteria bacterium]
MPGFEGLIDELSGRFSEMGEAVGILDEICSGSAGRAISETVSGREGPGIDFYAIARKAFSCGFHCGEAEAVGQLLRWDVSEKVISEAIGPSVEDLLRVD